MRGGRAAEPYEAEAPAEHNSSAARYNRMSRLTEDMLDMT